MIKKLIAADIPLTFPLAYAGLKNNWLSADDVVTYLDAEELSKLSTAQIGDFYAAAETFKEILVKFLASASLPQPDALTNALATWQYAFLSAVYQSSDPIHTKLYELANLWAMFNYPEDWKPFIHYLPVSETDKYGEAIVYGRFVTYYEVQNSIG